VPVARFCSITSRRSTHRRTGENMTSPPFNPGSRSRSREVPRQEHARTSGTSDQESPQQLGLLILGEAPQDDVSHTSIVAGGINSEPGRELDRDPTTAPSLESDGLVFDLRSTETAEGKDDKGRRFTNAYLVLLDEHGAS